MSNIWLLDVLIILLKRCIDYNVLSHNFNSMVRVRIQFCLIHQNLGFLPSFLPLLQTEESKQDIQIITTVAEGMENQEFQVITAVPAGMAYSSCSRVAASSSCTEKPAHLFKYNEVTHTL